MDPVVASAILLGCLFLFLAAGVWIALSLMAVGWVAMLLLSQGEVGKVLATSIWGAGASWSLSSLPLFIWMGEILFRTRLSENMFNGLAPWLNRIPGRLLHVNVLGCGIFAAVSGSSAATAATIGKMAYPELMKRNYSESMAIGSLAGSGTLGLLIPPSIMMIVYGVAAEVSITRLFIAGILPGILLMLLFSAYIAGWALLNPDKQPPPEPAVSWAQRLAALRELGPVVLLIAAIMGTIYLGIATATEAAAFGVVGALVISAISGTMTRRSIAASLMGAVVTTSMIGFILAGAAFLSTTMAFAGIPRALSHWVAAMHLSPTHLILAILVLYALLGCFLDGVSMVVLTSAVLLPMVQAAGIDLVWFGIFIVLTVEMSLVTPPVGFNLYVLQNLSGRSLGAVARASFPFFILMVIGVVLIMAFPRIVTFLPSRMIGA
jgi:C4-dicarboxylate transporter DctM subunit